MSGDGMAAPGTHAAQGGVSDETFDPAGPLRGTLAVPTDKSISHRAAIFGVMADGVSRVENYLDSADTRSSLAAVRALGGEVAGPDGPFDPAGGEALPPVIEIRGVGLHGARPAEIDAGNAGTLIRLISGWLAGLPGREWVLDGDDSIRQRPMARIAGPLRQMGALIEARDGDLAPLRIRGRQLTGIEYESPLASAQVKSCLLLAGLTAEGTTTVREPEPSRDHTERMLRSMGAAIEVDGCAVAVRPAEGLGPLALTVPGDISSAAFFMVAASIVPGSDITLTGVGVNPTRTGILDVLERMGASVELVNPREAGGEPVADLRVRHPGRPLRATEIGGAEIPRAIDELTILALAACFAEGRTVIRDAADLRRKESDRIATTVAALNAVGGRAAETEDGLVVEGIAGPEGAERTGSALRGGAADSQGDHRIAMLGAVAGIASREGVLVRDVAAAAVSYPTFATDLGSLLAPRAGGADPG